jgi:hypothetical protein
MLVAAANDPERTLTRALLSGAQCSAEPLPDPGAEPIRCLVLSLGGGQ